MARQARIALARIADIGARGLAGVRGRLGAKDRRRLAAMASPRRRRELLATRWLLQRLAPHERFDSSSAGVTGRRLAASVSHARGWVACALVAGGRIGVDIEPMVERDFDAAGKWAFGRAEGRSAFYRRWTRYEARVKAHAEKKEGFTERSWRVGHVALSVCAPRGARLALAAALLFATAVRAELQPLWETGLGATAFTLPDYRGSDESSGYVFPLPYIVLRDRRVRLDRQGLRYVFFEGARVEFNLSANAAPPVNSDQNRARQGMPNLDPTLEIGPQAKIALIGDQKSEERLELRLPLRAAIATDLSYAQSAGAVFQPHLNLDLRPRIFGDTWNLGLQAGVLFATRSYHQYYYGVDQRFATPQRPAYDAGGGYSGAVGLASLWHRFDKIWVGGFARYDWLEGATFDNSPLVKRKSSFMAGVGFAYIFAVSSEKVDVPTNY